MCPAAVTTETDPTELELRVQALTWEAEGVVGIRLSAPGGRDLTEWAPGAHIDLALSAAGQDGPVELRRQYSLCGDPGDRRGYDLGVLHEPTGRGGSHHLHTAVRPGAMLRVRAPRNHFPLVEAEEHLLVAGGIGITPLLPMAEDLARRGRPFRLLYGGRTAASMAFTARLRPLGAAVTFAPQDTHGLLDLAGALGPVRSGLAVHACGPEPLLAAMEAATADWPAGTLHVERFRAPGPAPVASSDGDADVDGDGSLEGGSGAERPFELVLARSGRTLRVGPSTSALDAVLGAGIEVLTDCREGICASCETRVLGGAIEHRDHVLSGPERAKGDVMMLCVSRAAGDRLVVDL